MNKRYYCLYESGVSIENETIEYTLEAVLDFCKSLANYEFRISDYEMLIQVGKLEIMFTDGYRLLVVVQDNGG